MTSLSFAPKISLFVLKRYMRECGEVAWKVGIGKWLVFIVAVPDSFAVNRLNEFVVRCRTRSLEKGVFCLGRLT